MKLVMFIFLSLPWVRAGAEALLIPGVAHASGALGSFWTSEVSFLNPSLKEATEVTCDFLQAGGAEYPATSYSFTLSAGEVKTFQDILEVMGAGDQTFGALLCSADLPILAFSTTQTPGSSGIYGQGFPALPLEEALEAGSSLKGTAYFFPLKGDTFRTNLGLINLSDTPHTYTLTLKRQDGTAVSQKTYTLQGKDMGQINDVYAFFGEATQDGDFITATATGEGPFTGYVTVIDNTTQDPSYFPARSPYQHGSSRYIIEASAEAQGAYQSRWQTSLWLINLEETSLEVTISFFQAGKDNSQPQKITLTLPAQGAKEIGNVYQDLFQLQDVFGALYVDAPGEFLLASRTFTGDDASGTYGLGIPGSSAVRPAPVPKSPYGWAYLPTEVREGYRLNAGIVNLSPREVTFTLTPLGDMNRQSTQITLQPFESQQINQIAQSASGIKVEPGLGAGPYFAYATRIHNQSNDGTFTPGLFAWAGPNRPDTLYIPDLEELVTQDWQTGEPASVSFGDPIEGEAETEYRRILQTFLSTPPFQKGSTPSPALVGWDFISLDGEVNFTSPTLTSLPGYTQGPDYLGLMTDVFSAEKIQVAVDLESIGFFIAKELFGDDSLVDCDTCPPPSPEQMPQIIHEVAQGGGAQVMEEQFIQFPDYPYIQKTYEGCNQYDVAYLHFFDEENGFSHLNVSEEYVYYPTTQQEVERQMFFGADAHTTGKLSLLFGHARYLHQPAGHLATSYALPMDYCLNLTLYRAFMDRDVLSLVEVWGLDFDTLRQRDWVRAFISPIATYLPPPSYRPKFNLVIDNPPMDLPEGQGEDFIEYMDATTDAITNAASSLGMEIITTYHGTYIPDGDIYYILTFGGYEGGDPQTDYVVDLHDNLMPLLTGDKRVFIQPIWGIPDLPNWQVVRKIFGMPEFFSFVNPGGSETTGLSMVDGDQLPDEATYQGKTFHIKGLHYWITPKANVIQPSETTANILVSVSAEGNPVPVLLQAGNIYLVNFSLLHLEASFLLHQVMASALNREPLWVEPGSFMMAADRRGVAILTVGTPSATAHLSWQSFNTLMESDVPAGKTTVHINLPFTSSSVRELIFDPSGNIVGDELLSLKGSYDKSSMDAMNLILLLPQ